MALVKLAKEGYGQLERNRFQNHNIEAQCELDASTFANGAEVGSIVAVDKPAGKIKLVGEVYGLLSNAEVLYNPMEMGLKNYHVEPGKMAVVNFLEVGNTFTTNTVKYDEAAYANGMADIKAALVKLLLRVVLQFMQHRTAQMVTLHLIVRKHLKVLHFRLFVHPRCLMVRTL